MYLEHILSFFLATVIERALIIFMIIVVAVQHISGFFMLHVHTNGQKSNLNQKNIFQKNTIFLFYI